MRGGKETRLGFVAHMDEHRSALCHLGIAALLGIEMILTGYSSNKLAIFGHFDALTVRFVGFHRV